MDTYTIEIDNNYVYTNLNRIAGNFTVIFTEDVTQIPVDAFNGRTGLEGSLTFPASLTSISYGAFNGCSKLTGPLTFPASLKTIGDHAFPGMHSTGVLV